MAKFNFKKVTENLTKKAPGLVCGAIASNYLGNAIDKMMKDKANPKMTGLLTLVAGALLPGIAGGKKDDLFTGIGDGMMASGGIKVLKAFGMPGIGDTDEYDAFAGIGDYRTDEDSMYETEVSGTDTTNSFL